MNKRRRIKVALKPITTENLYKEIFREEGFHVKPLDPDFKEAEPLKKITEEEFQTEYKNRIAQIIVARLGIQEGQVTFLLPKSQVIGLPGGEEPPTIVWAVEMSFHKNGNNPSIFTYRGPWATNYTMALEEALRELHNPLTSPVKSGT